MYGQGNYGHQFGGQGPHRPMPPYQQQSSGHPLPPPPMAQHGGPPHMVPPRGSAYPHAPPPPPSVGQQGPPVSMSNTSQSHLHPPLTVQGGPPRYPVPQQSYTPGTQNPHHGLPLPPPPPLGQPRLPPPPPSHGPAVYGQQGIQHMRFQPPSPPVAGVFYRPANFESAKQPDSQIPPVAPHLPPLPSSSPPVPPPPPSSSSPCAPGSVQVTVSESAADIVTRSRNEDDVPVSDESSRQGSDVDLPPPPPKPADEKIVRNIEVLCQFIAKNGPGFEDMARQNESGNPEFGFLFGGEPGSEASSSHEYYLWMKKKCSLVYGSHKGQEERNLSHGLVNCEPSVKPSNLPIVGTAHSPVDSDVDMEDDITQAEKEPGDYNSLEPIKSQPVSSGDMLELQTQESGPKYLANSTPPLDLSPSVKTQPDAETEIAKSLGESNKIDSPIRLIQNYASDDTSDDDGEPHHEEAKTVVSPPHKSQPISSHDDMMYNSMVSMSGKASRLGLDESVPASEDGVSMKNRDDSGAAHADLHEKVEKFSSPRKYEVHNTAAGAETATQSADFPGKYTSERSVIDAGSKCKENKKEEKKINSVELNVDEFGRLVKGNSSESESDDAYHSRRRGRRDRSRSGSRSPSDRRRRRSPRRSPRRRKEQRSRSRSWSPKRRRSRSRSPYRPGGDCGDERPRREKVQARECFDFLKGRCYRGASCRYMHHELDKSDSSRRYRSKHHHLEVATSSRNSEFQGKVHKMHSQFDKHDGGDGTTRNYDEKSKAELVHDAVQPSLLHLVDNSVADAQKGEGSKEEDARGASDGQISNLATDEEHLVPSMPYANEQGFHHSQSEASVQPDHRLDEEPQKMDRSTKIDSCTIQKSPVSACEVPTIEPHPSNRSNVPAGPSDPIPDLPPQIPEVPPPPPSEAANAPWASNMVDHNLMAPSVSFPPQSVPGYQAPLSNQQAHYPIPPNPSWSIPPLAQSRPPYIADPTIACAPVQFQQSNQPLLNDIPSQGSLKTHPGQLPAHSQVGGYQHQHYPLHSGNIPSQPFGGPNMIREDRYYQFPSQVVATSSSFAPGHVPPQPVPFSGDSSMKNMQAFPGHNLPLSETSKPTFQNHSFPLQRPSLYGPQPAAASTPSHLGGSLGVPGYSTDPLDRDHSTRLLDIGGSKISTHYNPYASTFDQPISTRFSSGTFAQQGEAVPGSKYDSSFGLGHAPVGQTASGHGSMKMIPSPNSSRAGGRTLPRSVGDQYDPLFDSIEPSSQSFKKHAVKQDQAADNSDIMLKFSSSRKGLDVEENKKQKEVGAVVATTSLENDEYGETADAEIGAVENGSHSDPDEDAIVAEGEIEIDQVKPEGKSKKNKDSRSMKLFKVAVANFVKDVLKPQWRQGNMSKEVFKTIVKKTVDKVSGAMKNNRVPKSQAKIDHYIDSSRRKLTHLVEGYVSKYKS